MGGGRPVGVPVWPLGGGGGSRRFARRQGGSDKADDRGLLTGVLVAAVLGFTDGTAGVLALTALLGVVFAVLQPAEFALVPPLAGNRIQEANGHVETARYLGFGIGP